VRPVQARQRHRDQGQRHLPIELGDVHIGQGRRERRQVSGVLDGGRLGSVVGLGVARSAGERGHDEREDESESEGADEASPGDHLPSPPSSASGFDQKPAVPLAPTASAP
jgi:hypothetical protein